MQPQHAMSEVPDGFDFPPAGAHELRPLYRNESDITSAIPSPQVEQEALGTPVESIRDLDPPQETPDQDAQTLGRPCQKKRMSLKDGLSMLLCLCCLSVSLVSIEKRSIATKLGQTNQLKVLGFLLSLMSLCVSNQLQLLLTSYEASSKRAILQNLDGILRLTPIAGRLQPGYRLFLSLIFDLPLVLSVAYKSFQGGSSNSASLPYSCVFGATGPPGTQNVGLGLSLFVNATLPWFRDPGFERTYGFNMYVASENTTAMLDGPMPEAVRQIQSDLQPGGYMNITAKVSAVVCSLAPQLSHSRDWLGSTFANDVQYNEDEAAYEQFVNKGHCLYEIEVALDERGRGQRVQRNKVYA